jgi:hypothetical protein
MRQLAILHELSAAEPYVDSQTILQRMGMNYRRKLAWGERQLPGTPKRQSVCSALRALPAEAELFVFRSCPVRVWIDRLVTLYLDGSPVPAREERAGEIYEKIVCAVPRLTAKDGDKDGAWRELQLWGYDLETPLINAFPAITSGWSGTSVSGASSASWNEAQEVETLFNQFMGESAGAEKVVLRSVNDIDACARVQDALSAIGEVSDLILTDIAINVRHVCIMDYARWPSMEESEYREIGSSMSRHNVPGVIFLARSTLESIEETVEALYHEALHRKLGNALGEWRILKVEYEWRESPRFKCAWNPAYSWNTNEWSFDRTLDAYHVYGHLICFYGAVLEHGSYASAIRARVAHERRSVSFYRFQRLYPWLREHERCMDKDGIDLVKCVERAVTRSLEDMPFPH